MSKRSKMVYSMEDFAWTEKIKLEDDGFSINCVVGFTNHAMNERMFGFDKKRNVDIYDVISLIRNKAGKILDCSDNTQLCILRDDKKLGIVADLSQNNETLFLSVITVIQIKRQLAEGIYTYDNVFFNESKEKVI